MSWLSYEEEQYRRKIEYERRRHDEMRFGLTAPLGYQGNINRGVKEVEKPIINKVLLLL